MWWPETGLNRRRRPFQGRALPLSYLASAKTSSCNFLARNPAMPDMVARPRTVFCNDLKQYTNSAFQRQTEPCKYTLECIFCSTLVGIMRRTVCTLSCLAFAVALYAQTPETRANHAYQAAAQRGPLAMHAFLAEFP